MTNLYRTTLLVLMVLTSFAMTSRPIPTSKNHLENTFINFAFTEPSNSAAPVYKSSKSKKGILKIEFENFGTGLIIAKKTANNKVIVTRERLKGFEIAGKDGVWKRAGGVIVSKNKIEIWNSSIENPEYVRYNWRSNTEKGNLFNREGIPVKPFSTKE